MFKVAAFIVTLIGGAGLALIGCMLVIASWLPENIDTYRGWPVFIGNIGWIVMYLGAGAVLLFTASRLYRRLSAV